MKLLIFLILALSTGFAALADTKTKIQMRITPPHNGKKTKVIGIPEAFDLKEGNVLYLISACGSRIEITGNYKLIEDSYKDVKVLICKALKQACGEPVCKES